MNHDLNTLNSPLALALYMAYAIEAKFGILAKMSMLLYMWGQTSNHLYQSASLGGIGNAVMGNELFL